MRQRVMGTTALLAKALEWVPPRMAGLDYTFCHTTLHLKVAALHGDSNQAQSAL